MKKIIIAAIIISIALPFGTIFSHAEVSGKIDDRSLLSRMEKYLEYGPPSTTWEELACVYYHNKVSEAYGNALGIAWKGILSFLDFTIISKYIDDNRDATPEYYKFLSFYYENKKDYLPLDYHLIRYENIPRADCEKAAKAYCEHFGIKDLYWIVDALYCDDYFTAQMTLMSPELVMDMDVYHGRKTGLFWITPRDVIGHSIDELDDWEYSDKFWLEYYEFIKYLDSRWLIDDKGNRTGGDDSIMWMADVHEQLDELDRRIDIYRARVGSSPDTGDGTAARASLFAAGAVLAAVVPALILTIKRRREEE